MRCAKKKLNTGRKRRCFVAVTLFWSVRAGPPCRGRLAMAHLPVRAADRNGAAASAAGTIPDISAAINANSVKPEKIL